MNFPAESITLEAARHEANILAKAASLSQRGYTGRWLTGEVVEIVGPEGRAYRLDLMAHTCECLGFQQNGICSHLLGYYPLVCDKEKPDA